MNHEATWWLLRASVWLTGTSLAVLILTRCQPLQRPGWHRWAWGVVLAQGLIFVPLSWKVRKPDWWPRTTLSTPSAETDAPQEFAAGPFERLAFTPLFPATAHAQPGFFTWTPNTTARERPRQVSAESRKSPPLASVMERVSLAGWLATAWGLGAAAVLFLFVRNFLRLRRALGACHTARNRWAVELRQLCQELGLRRPVRLDVHPYLGPCLCWTPVGYRVIVPVRLWNRLSQPERLAVLHHELCHLRRGDVWTACAARLVVALHWFNPMAWQSARRFEESAEWACDAQLAREAPARVTALANALLAAAQGPDQCPALALSATGGSLAERVRRLLIRSTFEDKLMHKLAWIGILAGLAVAGGIRLSWEGAPIKADEPVVSSEAAAESRPQGTSAGDFSQADSAALNEFARRIVVDEHPVLAKFIQVLKTPTGQIVMADRAAVTAQEEQPSADMSSQWQAFVTQVFESRDGKAVVNPAAAPRLAEFVRAVEQGEEEAKAIGRVFREVAPLIVDAGEPAAVLRKFLQHEAAPTFVYHSELRMRLHPGLAQVEEQFAEHLVRTRDGRYVVRPARRALVEQRLDLVEKFEAPLSRFEKELAAWADDLVAADAQHKRLAETLRLPSFARYIAFDFVPEDSQRIEEDLEGMFHLLEDATNDTASGLRLDPASEAYKDLNERIDRFRAVWEAREELAAPLRHIADRMDATDDLQRRLQAFLRTEFALMSVFQQMQYQPVGVEEAAREWLSQMITRNDAGRYELTVESTEDLQNQIEQFFREFREVRRRGRVVDEFAAQIEDTRLKLAFSSLLGKLQLGELMAALIERPEVDGLARWFEQHFEETPEGLKLYEWAVPNIEQVLSDAAELERQAAKQDF
jgi:beta-lactamase regulating signal transducer with metallopeptidase domain